MDEKRDRRALPFHPVLFAVAPILFVYLRNAAKFSIGPGELLLPIALSLAATAVMWAVLGFLLRGATRAAPVVSLFLVLFFSFAPFVRVLRLSRQSWADLLLFWALLMIAGFWLAARSLRPGVRVPLLGITVLLNSIGAATLAINLVTGVQAFARRPRRIEDTHQDVEEAALPVGARPDIYYVILDGYGRADILRSIYGYDDSSFLDRLRQMGFYVAERSRSNYCQTVLSLASSLNLVYLDSIAEALGPESEDRRTLQKMLAESRFMSFLKQQGYAVMAFATGYSATDFRNADFYRAPPWSTTEFRDVLLGNTVVPALLEVLGLKTQYDLHRDRVLYALDHLVDAVEIEQPVFVFAHITSPHPPFVLGADGEPKKPGRLYDLSDGNHFHRNDPALRAGYIAGYRDQLAFVSTKVVSALEQILARSPTPPYIILQSDHGPGSRLDWRSPESTDMAERTSILNAYHFPGQEYSMLYDSITPVNTFRLLMNDAFGIPLDPLPDRAYFTTWRHPYRFIPLDSSLAPGG